MKKAGRCRLQTVNTSDVTAQNSSVGMKIMILMSHGKTAHILAQHCPHHCNAPATHHVFQPSYESCDSDVSVFANGVIRSTALPH